MIVDEGFWSLKFRVLKRIVVDTINNKIGFWSLKPVA